MIKAQKKLNARLLFYISIVALPVIQFIIFYIVVNFKSIMFAFQEYDIYNGYTFNFTANFERIFQNIQSEPKLVYSVKNSLVLYFCNLIVGTGGAVLFSNYIYKKNFGNKFFQVILFLPHIISGVVLMAVYKFMMDTGVPEISLFLTGKEIDPLLSNVDNQFVLVLIFTLYMSFGTQVLMYTSTMSGISPSVVESAQLDGITPLKELIFITLPMIYPTFVTFITVGIAGMFTNQMSLYSFYGSEVNPKVYTFGYFLYRETQVATEKMDYTAYTYLSAFGLLLTAIAISLTFGVKKVMEKFGPSVD